MRAHSNDEFDAAVAHATELHAEGELFSRHIESEPAPEDPVDWAMAEATDGEDDEPMPEAPPELELIDMPPAPASALPMTNLERCIALRLVYGRRTMMSLVKNAQPSSHSALCCHTCPLSP